MWSIALTCISPRVNRLYYSIIILFRSLSSGDVLSNAGSLKAWAVKAVVATLDRYSYFFFKNTSMVARLSLIRRYAILGFIIVGYIIFQFTR